jgi:site-specific recombinase XerD
MRVSEAPPAAFTDQLELWLNSNDFSDNTIVLYGTAARQWLSFAMPWQEGWPVRSIQWRKSMAKAKKALKTQAVFVGAAKGYIDWLMDEKVLEGRNPLASVKFRGINQQYGRRRPLTDDEVRMLLALCDRKTVIGLRDNAVLMIMLHTALRIGAISKFDVEDIEKRGDLMVVNYQGKGQQSKARFKVLPPNVLIAIKAYLKKTDRALSDKGPLWAKRNGKRITIHGIRKSIVRKMDECGIKDAAVSTHSLRHTAATKAIESGIDLQAVQDLMDHESLATTDRYAHFRRKLKDAAELTIDYDLEKKNGKRRRSSKRKGQGKAARSKAD